MKMAIGAVLYLIGLVGAILVGLLEGFSVMPEYTWIAWVLVLAGLGIGFFNVTSNEAQAVIVAAIGLGAAAGVLAIIPTVGGVLESILSRIAFISLPVAIPPAIRVLVEKLR